MKDNNGTVIGIIAMMLALAAISALLSKTGTCADVRNVLSLVKQDATAINATVCKGY